MHWAFHPSPCSSSPSDHHLCLYNWIIHPHIADACPMYRCFQLIEFFIMRSYDYKCNLVSVPCNSLLNMVTVRCGHCANLLSVNTGGSLQSTTIPPQDPQKQHLSSEDSNKNCGSSSSSSSSKSNKFGHAFESLELHEQPRVSPIPPPEKRQRVPSAYNRFIKEEIQRIKASNPDISHREAFSKAAKNWAHFPHIHFGLKLDANKQPKLDQAFAGKGT